MMFTRFAANSFSAQATRASRASPNRASSLVLLYITFGAVAPFALPLKSSLSAHDHDREHCKV